MITTYNANAYVSNNGFLLLGNYDTHDEASDALLEHFTDKETFEIFETDLAMSNITKVDWFEYQCTFKGYCKNKKVMIDFVEETILSKTKLDLQTLLENINKRYDAILNFKLIKADHNL